MSFWYMWLIVVWMFQSVGFARAYIQNNEESFAARNVAMVIHLITLVALLNIR